MFIYNNGNDDYKENKHKIVKRRVPLNFPKNKALPSIGQSA